MICCLLALAACGSSGLSLTVINQGEQAICYLYISPSSEQNWYEDELGANIIVNDGSFVIDGLSDDTYSLLAIFCDGREFIETNIDVGDETTVVVPPPP